MGKSTLRFALLCAVLLLAAATCHSLRHDHPDLAAHPGHSVRLVKRGGAGNFLASLRFGGKASKMAKASKMTTAGAGTVDESAELASNAARFDDGVPTFTIEDVARARAEAYAEAFKRARNDKAIARMKLAETVIKGTIPPLVAAGVATTVTLAVTGN